MVNGIIGGLTGMAVKQVEVEVLMLESAHMVGLLVCTC